MSYAYSFNIDGNFGIGEYDTINDAVKAAKKDNPDAICAWVGEYVEYVPKIDAVSVIEDIQRQASNDCGEYGDEYLDDVSENERKELDSQLNKVFTEWVEKNGFKPNFGIVENIKKYDL